MNYLISAGSYLILAIYIVALAYITLFCIMQFHLLYLYRKEKKKKGIQSPPGGGGDLPIVTIQLPIYNELYVVERLIDNIVKINYPKDLLEIQVLDDSTDETVEITKAKVKEYQEKGFDIKHIHRKDRKGFKAGALHEGLQVAKGEFVAIFDADFLPKPNFIINTIDHFKDPNVAVVQTRWEHINESYSLITELQAFQLNVHFSIEQTGRQAGQYMLQFNGTAGIWRRTAVDDAGGWQPDTLTEDLDLSYRAQLKGWKIMYLEEIGSPAELPAEMNGLKSQQHRWMKGGAETAKKILPSVWKSDISFGKKFHATLHLMASGIFIFVFIIGVFSVPVLFMLKPLGIDSTWFAICLTGLLSIVAVYYVANVKVAWADRSPARMVLKFIFLFPLFLSLSMGLSLHNSVAVIQGWIGKKSAFVRTPKFNLKGVRENLNKKKYLSGKFSLLTILEGVLTLYFATALIAGIASGNTAFLIFHIMLMIGYGMIFYYTLRNLRYK